VEAYLSDRLTKLLAVEGVGDGLVESSLRESNHLRRNTDTTLIQDLDGVSDESKKASTSGLVLFKGGKDELVANSLLSQQVFRGHLDVVEVERTCRRGANTELWENRSVRSLTC
jgi:hypothetical protein